MESPLDDISIHSWLLSNQIVNEKGERIEFRDHPFLFDIYSDDSPNLVIQKAAQVGLSTLAILKVLWVAAKRKLDLVYTLPTQQDVQTFVGGRVNRLIAQNPILQEYTRDKDTIEQKQVFNSMCYWRGTFTEREAIMVSADLLVHDELDSSNVSIVDFYEARLQHSKFKWRWVFSHPSVPGYGVSRFWEISDQKSWFVKCGGCEKEQSLAWPDSIDVKGKVFVCRHCGKGLPDDSRRSGRWVPKYADRKWSGYLVSLLMCPWVSAEEIVDKYERNPTEFFHNKVLGLPFEGAANTVPAHVIQRCVQDVPNKMEGVVIGCDSGLAKHWVAGTREGVFAFGKTEDWKDIEAMLNRYPRSVAILDALPDLTAPRDLRKKYPGRVYLGNFTRDRKGMQIARWGKGKEEGGVLIDRHRAIQSVVDEFQKGSVVLNGKADYWKEFIRHWQNIYRVKELDAMGRPVFLWEKKNTEDHWCMAHTLLSVGLSRFGGKGGIFGVEPQGPSNDRLVFSPSGRASLPNPGDLFEFDSQGEDWRN